MLVVAGGGCDWWEWRKSRRRGGRRGAMLMGERRVLIRVRSGGLGPRGV